MTVPRTPTRTQYTLVLSLFLVVSLLLTASPTQADPQETVVGGPITTDTTWSATNSPYVATSSVLVPEGVTLTIEPGVTVKFDAEKALQVSGTLVAQGTADDPIVFTANTDTPERGHWGYLLFDATSTDATFDDYDGTYTGGSILQYATVEYAGFTSDGSSSRTPAVRIEESSPFIDHATIRYNQHHGVHGRLTSSRITNSTIAHNRGNGILIDNKSGYPDFFDGAVTIDGNIISNNYGTDGAVNYPANLGGGGIHVYYNQAFDPVNAPSSKITNNVIEYNRTDVYGGGIYAAGMHPTMPIVIEGNVIRHNIANVAGGIYAEYNTTIRDNEIYENMGHDVVTSGIYNEVRGAGVGGIFVGHTATIEGNRIVHNYSLDAGGGGISTRRYSSVNITGNTVAGNYSTAYGGGLFMEGIHDTAGATVTHNTIAFNSAEVGGNGAWFREIVEVVPVNVSYNTVVGNVSGASQPAGHDTALCIYCNHADSGYTGTDLPTYTVQHNNFIANTIQYALTNNFRQGDPDLDATYNWWGTTDTSQINDLIYDFFDNSEYGVTDYSNYLSGPDTDAPVSPPTNLSVSVDGSDFTLSWDENPESDVAGYKVYYDDDAGYPYDGTGANEGDSGIDAGNTTNFTLTGLPTDQYAHITVTAHDQNGNESWYARLVKRAAGQVPFQNGNFEQGPNHGWEKSNANVIVTSSALPEEITPRSGDYVAALGYAQRFDTDLSQQVYVDPEKTTLRYYYILWKRDSHINNLCQFGEVSVSIDGTTVAEYSNCADTMNDGWTLEEIDLSDYAGQLVTLTLHTRNVNGNLLVVDDVSFVAGGGTAPTEPALTVNHDTGAPGSHFTFNASGFPADSSATILVNGVVVDTLFTDASGFLPFILYTGNLSVGSYVVTVQVNPNATASFRLEEDAPVHPQEGSGTIITVPPDVAPMQSLYVPLVVR